MANIRNKKLREWNKDPHCRYCGVLTVLRVYKEDSKEIKDRLATIDHTNSRWNPNRQKPNNGREVRRVLSCHKCNHERNVKEMKQLPKEVLWEKSRRKPLLDRIIEVEKEASNNLK